MKVVEYQKKGISLESLPLNVLRGIDIETPDEEKIIQELVNRKMRFQPVPIVINRPGDRTDFKTPAEEAEFQRVIDERIESAKPKVEEVTVSKFCQFCTAKGPIAHMKVCTRPAKALGTQLAELKAQRKALE